MTKQYQRFHAAVAAMQGLLADPVSSKSLTHEEIVNCAVATADALLAELDRTAPKDEPQPDADGWIPHVPGDPMPCDPDAIIVAMLRDGHICQKDRAEYFCFDKDQHAPNEEIVAWKPVAWRPEKQP